MYNDELIHYGTKRHSGRYPYGSGEEPFQHESQFLNTVDDLKKKGLSEKEIAEYFDISTTELRERKSIEKTELRKQQYAYANNLYNQGFTKTYIAEKLGINESNVRYLLQESDRQRLAKKDVIENVIKNSVDEQDFIDIGSGSERMIGVSPEYLKVAVRSLKDKGYNEYYIKVPQAGIPGQYTTVKVLAKPGMKYSDVVANRDSLGSLEGHQLEQLYSNDGGKTVLGIEKPTSVDSKRIMVRYTEDGGSDKDGVIELRRGVEDLSLGKASYAQVRIAVDGTHYLKGMALYSDNMPDGVDIIFNTNKSNSTPKMDVFKKLKKDSSGEINWDNPFGATLRMEEGVIVGQSHYISKDGKEKLSPVNIVREEGDWSKWSRTLSAQFLAKQPVELIKQQLDITYAKKLKEYEDISSLTNPEVKKKLLQTFSESCESDASHLKAVALPRQESKVILPIDISDKEIYAPSFRDGEEVALVRYPHGGTFEIPLLRVNNRCKSGIDILGKTPIDAVGISAKTAQQLSGADFDGDTVVVIPTKGQKIKATSPLEGLKNFDPKVSYGPSDIRPKGSYKVMTEAQKQSQMGKVSNLITDMTLKGASPQELTRAVRHSMVVIDAVKHELDYVQSEIDNGIPELKIKYQGGKNRGASTLISRANSDYRDVIKDYSGNPKTMELPVRPKGSIIFKDGAKYKDIKGVWNKYDEESKNYIPTEDKVSYKLIKGVWHYKGKGNNYIPMPDEEVKYKTQNKTVKTTKMKVVEDAYELTSGLNIRKENEYANYANKLKALANKSLKESMDIQPTKRNPSAAKAYEQEVNTLNAKLNIALKNSVYERKAQILADVTFKNKLKDNPDMDDDDQKKVKIQALAEARRRTGASRKKSQIDISEKEWEAIQAHALSSSKISLILQNANQDQYVKLAMPKQSNDISPAQEARIRNMINSGYTQSEIADALGYSSSTISKYVKDA